MRLTCQVNRRDKAKYSKDVIKAMRQHHYVSFAQFDEKKPTVEPTKLSVELQRTDKLISIYRNWPSSLGLSTTLTKLPLHRIHSYYSSTQLQFKMLRTSQEEQKMCKGQLSEQTEWWNSVHYSVALPAQHPSIISKLLCKKGRRNHQTMSIHFQHYFQSEETRFINLQCLTIYQLHPS